MVSMVEVKVNLRPCFRREVLGRVRLTFCRQEGTQLPDARMASVYSPARLPCRQRGERQPEKWRDGVNPHLVVPVLASEGGSPMLHFRNNSLMLRTWAAGAGSKRTLSGQSAKRSSPLKTSLGTLINRPGAALNTLLWHKTRDAQRLEMRIEDREMMVSL